LRPDRSIPKVRTGSTPVPVSGPLIRPQHMTAPTAATSSRRQVLNTVGSIFRQAKKAEQRPENGASPSQMRRGRCSTNAIVSLLRTMACVTQRPLLKLLGFSAIGHPAPPGLSPNGKARHPPAPSPDCGQIAAVPAPHVRETRSIRAYPGHWLRAGVGFLTVPDESIPNHGRISAERLVRRKWRP
jgi:hypothetical protein